MQVTYLVFKEKKKPKRSRTLIKIGVKINYFLSQEKKNIYSEYPQFESKLREYIFR